MSNMEEDFEIAIIAAYSIDSQGRMVIGSRGKLPWNIRQELEHFKNQTTGNACLFGRKTFESIGKALPNRLNIVLSSSLKIKTKDVIAVRSIEEAISHAKKSGFKKLFICGGESIYKSALEKNICRRLILSEIKSKDTVYSGDCFFPKISSRWKLISEEQFDDFCVKIFE